MILAELFPYADMVYNVLWAVYVVTVVGTVGVIIGENRNPVKSLAWVTVLLLLPAVGLVLYFLFGRSIKRVHLISRKDLRRLKATTTPESAASELPEGFSDLSSRQARLAKSLVGAPVYAGNHIDIFTAGKEKFDALKRDLQAAKNYIHLQYYIFENDVIGHEMRDILVAKAREGVEVRVTYDHVGSFTINAAFFQRMRREGVDAHAFLRLTFTQLANRLNWRNHRKLVVVDGRVGYIGGMNIADRYVTGARGRKPWRDTHLRITGPAVAGLCHTFAIDWNFMRRELLTLPIPAIAPQAVHPGSDWVQVLPSGPTGQWSNIMSVLLKAIGDAKQSVWIQTPYFLPNDALLKALQTTALSGVDVRLMLPRRSDSRLLRLAAGSYLKECLLSGIKVYFYEPAMLHSKLIVVDDDFTTTGSTNFDFRSFEHNFECNVLVYSREFNQRMRAVFQADQRQSTRIILSHWRRRPVMVKAAESLVRLLSPIL